MMKKSVNIALLLAATAVPGVAQAQDDLTKEITIDRIIVPEERAASRLNANPTLLTPYVKPVKLSFTEYGEPSAIKRSLAFSEPVAWGDTLVATPYRGYAVLGYFPTLNAGASIGYRLINTKRTVLSAWLQDNYYNYRSDYQREDKARFRENAFTVDLGLRQKIGEESVLTAGIDYSNYNIGRNYIKEGLSQGVNNFKLNAGWESHVNGLEYEVKAGWNYFGFTKDENLSSNWPIVSQEAYAPVHENGFNFDAGMKLDLDEKSAFGADIEAEFLSYNRASSFDGVLSENEAAYTAVDAKTRGVITLAPYYQFAYQQLTAHVGVKAQYTVNSGKKFHLAPDVLVNWAPASSFSVYAKLGGGEQLNALSELWQDSHFMTGNMVYQNSHVPITIDGGFVVGLFKGFTFEAFGGYARANDWLMPMAFEGVANFFSAGKLYGWHAGAKASYQYNDLFNVHASIEAAPQGEQSGYYLWRDRAKWQATAGVSVNPIKRLTVDVDYTYRAKRCSYDLAFAPEEECLIDSYCIEKVDLGAINDLTVGVSYQFLNTATFYGRVENLLGKKYLLDSNVPAQGIHGLVGVALKF
jgi:opacity protein-like surface antigen